MYYNVCVLDIICLGMVTWLVVVNWVWRTHMCVCATLESGSGIIHFSIAFLSDVGLGLIGLEAALAHAQLQEEHQGGGDHAGGEEVED